jgi:hypothetical protein
MPGDPRECRRHALRCAELAVSAGPQQLKAALLTLRARQVLGALGVCATITVCTLYVTKSTAQSANGGQPQAAARAADHIRFTPCRWVTTLLNYAEACDRQDAGVASTAAVRFQAPPREGGDANLSISKVQV